MNPSRFLSALVVLSLLAAEGLSAQRRGTSGGSSGSGGRSTPSGGGSSSGGTRSSPSGGSRGSSGGTTSGGTTSGGTTSSGNAGSKPATSRAGGSESSGSGTTTTATETRREGGKIGAIREAADRDNARTRGGVVYGRGVYLGSCWDCDYWGYYGPRWGWYHGGYWYPAHRGAVRGDSDEPRAGQGYDDYPYAGGDTAGFVKPATLRRRGYGVLTGQYFSDAGSTARGGRFGIEGARGLFRGELEYAYTNERLSGGATDQMHDFRIAGGIQPRLGNNAYLTATLGVRAIGIPGGRRAGGLEGGLGVQLLPRRPFGVNITGRAAAMSWNGQDYFALRELNTTGSIFVNRMELQGGWHWLKIGDAPAFGGPVAALRIWF